MYLPESLTFSEDLHTFQYIFPDLDAMYFKTLCLE